MPVAAVAVSAPAFAASQVCEPQITLGATSCKCPGQSQGGNEFAYFLSFCITDAQDCDISAGTTFTITGIQANPGAKGALTSEGCGGIPGFTEVTGTVGTNGGCTVITRGVGESSANGLDITFVIGGETFTTEAIPAPPNCEGTLATQRCTNCAPA